MDVRFAAARRLEHARPEHPEPANDNTPAKRTGFEATDRFERAQIFGFPRASGAPLSRIGLAVEQSLRSGHPLGKGSTWNVGTGNELSGAGGRPWLVQSPPATNRPLQDGHSEFLHDEVRDTIVSAKNHVTLATLASPDEKYLETISQSLKELAAKQPKDGKAVDVRVLIGSVQDDKGVQHGLDWIRDRITRDLPKDARVKVSVGTYAGQKDSPLSFSHTKIVSADGREALVGGHNWWSNEYNTKDNPVYDLSMRVKGGAAQHGEDFFDSLWGYTKNFGNISTREARDEHGRLIPTDVKTEPQPKKSGGATVITVGTSGGVSHLASGTSDTALYAMIDAAEKNVKISAQDLASMELNDKEPRILGLKLPWKVSIPQHLSPGMADHLGRALLRGVKVDIGLSTDNAGGYSHGWSPEKTKRALLDHVKKLDPRADMKTIEERLDVRGLYTAQGAKIRNHAKMLSVDDQAFYVGSQNFYPGGMKETMFTQLAELGYIVDDQRAARELIRDYWDPLWRNSR